MCFSACHRPDTTGVWNPVAATVYGGDDVGPGAAARLVHQLVVCVSHQHFRLPA